MGVQEVAANPERNRKHISSSDPARMLFQVSDPLTIPLGRNRALELLAGKNLGINDAVVAGVLAVGPSPLVFTPFCRRAPC